MRNAGPFEVRAIGVVRSALKNREECPHQGFEGAPEAEVIVDPAFAGGLSGLAAGDEVILLTWFHQAGREALAVHPQNHPKNPLRGVFLTRSPDRPNPIGLHRVRVLEADPAGRLRVAPLEAIDGTPLIDIKPVLAGSDDA
jgi:tRNA-Thr(GGU) m(6)t(6)A37 methyltransferase TsaA